MVSGAARLSAPTETALPAPRQRRPSRLRAVPPVDERQTALVDELVALHDNELDAAADSLHDGALQVLVAARYAADAAVRGGDPVLVRDCVQEALVSLRQAMWTLRPRTRNGLIDALEQLSAHRAQAGRAPLTLHVHAPTAERLSPLVAALAYRFIQAADSERARLVRSGDSGLLDVDAVLGDADGWRRRAAAVGAELMVADGRSALLLPLDPSALGVLPVPSPVKDLR